MSIINIKTKSRLLLCIPFLVLSFIFAEKAYPKDSIKAVSYCNKKNIRIGERLHYFTAITCPSDVEIEFPVIKDKIGIFEIKDSGEKQANVPNRKKIIKLYILCAYDTGEHTIPGISVKWRHKNRQWSNILSNDVTIEIESIFEKTKIRDDIRDVEPPVSFVWEYKLHLIFGLALLVILFFAVELFVRRRGEKLKRIAEGPPKDEVSYSKLSQIVLSISTEITRANFIEIAQLSRGFLEYRFKLKTTALTTDEFLNKSRDIKNLTDKHGEWLRFALRTADLMKFANYNSSKEEHSRLISGAKELLKDIKPQSWNV